MATSQKNVIKSYIILRHDTAEKWKNSNTVLKKGEIVLSIESDGKQFLKAGDGEKTWKELPYIPVRAEDIVNLEIELEKSICITNLSNQVTQVSQKVDSVVSGSVTSEEKEKLESFTAQDVTEWKDGYDKYQKLKDDFKDIEKLGDSSTIMQMVTIINKIVDNLHN